MPPQLCCAGNPRSWSVLAAWKTGCLCVEVALGGIWGTTHRLLYKNLLVGLCMFSGDCDMQAKRQSWNYLRGAEKWIWGAKTQNLASSFSPFSLAWLSWGWPGLAEVFSSTLPHHSKPDPHATQEKGCRKLCFRFVMSVKQIVSSALPEQTG